MIENTMTPTSTTIPHGILVPGIPRLNRNIAKTIETEMTKQNMASDDLGTTKKKEDMVMGWTRVRGQNMTMNVTAAANTMIMIVIDTRSLLMMQKTSQDMTSESEVIDLDHCVMMVEKVAAPRDRHPSNTVVTTDPAQANTDMMTKGIGIIAPSPLVAAAVMIAASEHHRDPCMTEIMTVETS